MSAGLSESLDPALLPDGETLVQITGDVFAGLFGEDRGRPYPDPTTASLTVSAHVTVSGGWSGQVVVAAAPSLVRRAAAELFSRPDRPVAETEVTDDDLRDVIGEFANVIGGNVKSVMPGPSALSLPVTSLDDSPPSGAPATRVELTWLGEPLRVTVSTIPPSQGAPS